MTTTEKGSISEQVIELLYSKGAMTAKQMAEFVGYPVKSVHGKCLELMTMGLLDREKGGGPKGLEFIWSLRPGVTPRTLATGEIEEVEGSEEPSDEESEPTAAKPRTPKPAPIMRSKGVPLDQKDMFIEHLVRIGVSPKDAIPSIAELFFAGDIEDLKWLNHVLQREAMGYVSPQQRRLTLAWWSKTRGLPYQEDDYFLEDEGEEKGRKATRKGGKEEEEKPKVLDVGAGWRIGKDRQGDWVPLMGGPMTYHEAVEAAKERHLITTYGRAMPTEEAEGGEEEEGKPPRGGKRGESMVDYMMKKLVDNLIDGQKGKGDGENDTVKRLTERIDDMEREKTEDRFERMEGLVAQIANRDPWDDYDRIQEMKARLGGGGPTVTDQSPAVQLIKDTTDKADKNVNRLVGMIERVVLRSDEFKPEETRSREEREERAGELLDTARSGDRHRRQRRDTFGI